MSKTSYVCESCGDIKTKWQGKCTSCNSWNSYVKMDSYKNQSLSKKEIIQSKCIAEIVCEHHTVSPTKIHEVDRVFGGGLFESSVNLIGGPPGVGKSSLVAAMLKEIPQKILYVSGEESLGQVSRRFKRLKVLNEKVQF